MVNRDELLADLKCIEEDKKIKAEEALAKANKEAKERHERMLEHANNIMEWLGPLMKENVESRCFKLGIWSVETFSENRFPQWKHIAGYNKSLGFNPSEQSEYSIIVKNILENAGFTVSFESETSHNYSFDGDGNSYDTHGYHTDYYIIVKW